MLLKQPWLLGFIAILFITPQVYANENEKDITIVQGANQRVLTETNFKQLPLNNLVVQDPVYKRQKHYAGYWLTDIFALIGINTDPHTVWTFKALDGYTTSIAVADVLKTGAKAFIAIADIDKEEGWEMIQQGKEWISPGPYYLVWQTPLKNADSAIKLPWPYQMIEISIHQPDEFLQKILENNKNFEELKKF